MHMKSIYS